jgi:outer membrane autotransporter protein
MVAAMRVATSKVSLVIFGALLVFSSGVSAKAQSVILPPGQIFTNNIAYGRGLAATVCGGQPCPFNGAVTNGSEADLYLQPYTGIGTNTPPFIDSTSAPVGVVWTSAPTQYVRFYTGDSAAGSWVAPSNQVRGKTAEQIKDLLALPTTPTGQAIALLPAHTCLLVGKAGPITNANPANPSVPSGFWGNGGATQAFLIGKSENGCGPNASPDFVDRTDFINGQAIGAYALAYVPRAGRGNAGAVAFALDHAIFPEQFTDADGVYNALDILNFGQAGPLRHALTQLDGEINSNIQSVMIGAGRMFLEVLQDQTHLARTSTIKRFATGWRPWISGLGGGGYLNGGENYRGLNFTAGGVSFGADYLFNPEFQIGLSGAYTRSSFATNGVSGSGNIDSYSIGSYAGYALRDFYLDAAVGYAFNQAGVNRNIVFPGVSRVANANPNNDVVLSRAEFGYKLQITERLRATPFAAFQGIVAFARNFSESGAGAVSLNVMEKNLATATSTAGAELSYAFPIGFNAPLTLSGRAGWTHDFADVKRKTLQNFQGILQSNFWAEGAAWPQNAASVGAKLVLPVAEADLFVRYDGLFANNAEFSSATGGLTMKF